MDKSTFKVYSENWKKVKEFDNLRAAKAYRSQYYGYAGYIIEYDADDNEIANHS